MKKLFLTMAIALFGFGAMGQAVKHEWQRAVNVNNPFDEIGLKHNLICKAFIQSEYFNTAMKEKSREQTRSSLKLFFEDCCKRKKMECCGGTGPYDPTEVIEEVFSNNSKSLQDLMYRRYKLSSICTSYAKTIVDMGRKRSEQFIKEIIGLEKKISNDKKLPQNERALLLKMSSVARFSAVFWQQQTTNPSNSFKKIDWDRTGVVDTIGSLFGPEGVAVGSIADLILQCLE